MKTVEEIREKVEDESYDYLAEIACNDLKELLEIIDAQASKLKRVTAAAELFAEAAYEVLLSGGAKKRPKDLIGTRMWRRLEKKKHNFIDAIKEEVLDAK